MKSLSLHALMLLVAFVSQEPATQPQADKPVEKKPAAAPSPAKIEGVEMVGKVTTPDGVSTVQVQSGETVPNRIANGNPNMLAVKLVVAEGVKDANLTMAHGGSSVYSRLDSLDDKGNLVFTAISMPADGQVIALEAFGTANGKPVKLVFQVVCGRVNPQPPNPQFAPKPPAVGAQQPAVQTQGRLIITVVEQGPGTRYGGLVSGANPVQPTQAVPVPTYILPSGNVVRLASASDQSHLQYLVARGLGQLVTSLPMLVVQEDMGNGKARTVRAMTLTGAPNEISDALKQLSRK